MERIGLRRQLTIGLPGGAGFVKLSRCDDQVYGKAASQSMPILLTNPRLYSVASDGRLGLPELYAVLTTLTGPSGHHYYPWKGAFAFPFKMTVHRGDRQFRYLLKITNFRSLAEPELDRFLLPGEHYSKSTYHAPFDDELSEDDMLHVVTLLRGFLEYTLVSMPKWTSPS
jgi:hypothetical protein